MKRRRDDEFDDGGTRHWRANQATWERNANDRWAKWRALPFTTKAITIVFLVFFSGPAFYAAGLLFLVYLHWLGIDPG